MRALQVGDRRVAMAGDGVNVAPALAPAGFDIAVGGGADATIALGRATMRTLRWNLACAFGYNALLISVAAGLGYAAFEALVGAAPPPRPHRLTAASPISADAERPNARSRGRKIAHMRSRGLDITVRAGPA